MQRILLVVSATLLAACTTAPLPSDPGAERAASDATTSSTTAEMMGDPYAEGWDVSRGWPGEYPPGFSVLEDNIVLPARSVMNPNAAQDLACPLPKFATYQQWNIKRADADALEFRTATKLFDITMTTSAPIEVPGDELGMSPKLLNLQKGDVLVYKRYLGEGFAIIGFDGTDYEINEVELTDISDFAAASINVGYQEDLWVNVACADEAGTRAWILYEEARESDGIGPTPIFGFGDSRDLTGFDLPAVYQQIEQENEFGF